MSVRTRAQLNSDADSAIPDNTVGEVSPADVRQRIKDLADSARLAEDLGDAAAKNTGTTAGTVAAGDDSRIANAAQAASAFGTDNRLLRSDGTGRGVQGSGITVDDSDRMTGHGNMAWQAATQGAGGITFDCDSGKLLNWYITASAARQVQVPSNLPDGWTAYLEIDPSGNAITWAAGFRSPVPDVSTKAVIAMVRRGSEYVAGIFHEV